ncbi:MAG: MarR family transcriptional regulator [Ramlibacter sp.]|nr:MarR family transcriptional regulator [Ramlibacter sp.]
MGLEVRQQGAQSVMTSQIVAARFGLHTTDLECLDLIYLRKVVSAGELAIATGLTTGAMTTLIDRLENAGYVVRERDTQDRRKVHVRINEAAIEPIKAVYAPIQRQMHALWSSYSDQELESIADFLARSRALAVACAAEIQRNTPPGATKRRLPRTAGMDRTKEHGNG